METQTCTQHICGNTKKLFSKCQIVETQNCQVQLCYLNMCWIIVTTIEPSPFFLECIYTGFLYLYVFCTFEPCGGRDIHVCSLHFFQTNNALGPCETLPALLLFFFRFSMGFLYPTCNISLGIQCLLKR